MKKILLYLFLIVPALPLSAQTSWEELKRHPKMMAADYVPYYYSKKPLAPPPAGYEPFYISHYGRHGSRYIIESEWPYEELDSMFAVAEKENALSPYGKRIRKKFNKAYGDAQGKAELLTPLGGRQHEGIARRMYRNFPEVFRDGAYVDARASVINRCSESMNHFCDELLRLHPGLNLHRASRQEDMYIVAHPDDSLRPTRAQLAAADSVYAFGDRLCDSVHIGRKLFRDPDFLRRHNIREGRVAEDFYHVACNMLCLPELGLSFKGLFSKRDLFRIWQDRNLEWAVWAGYIHGVLPYYESDYYLLENIISWADDVIREGRHGASLRFGHDSYLLPLTYLMRIDGCCGYRDMPLGEWYKQFAHYRIAPMAGNVQIIFYRKQGSDDVLVKILLQEAERSLPIPTDCAPYYHWRDVKALWQKSIRR